MRVFALRAAFGRWRDGALAAWGHRSAGREADGTGVSVEPPSRPLRLALVEIAALALAFAAYVGIARGYSSDVPGGADAWGYVSEAARLRAGHFYEPEHVLARFGLPEDAPLTEALGYTSKGKAGTVPVYPFGYPLLMALAMLLAGHAAAFWVTPVLAAGTVLLTYLLGRALLGRGGGAIAAAFLAFFPNFIWGAIQPLSGVPAAFFCALALFALLAVRAGWPADALLGAALGYAVWVRPNMALLAAVVVGWLVVRREWRRLARTGAVLLPFLAVAAGLNWHLYGEPWRTGYGLLAFGGPLREALARGALHVSRLGAQQAGVGVPLFVLALLWNRLATSRRVLLGAVFAAFVGFFAAYRFSDAWWYFRFLVPAMPAVVVLEAGLLVRLAGAGRWSGVRRAAVVLAACAVAYGEQRYGVGKHIYTLKQGEQRYPNAARLAASVVKQPALVVAMQHSGTLRYYAGLPSLRYDIPSPQRLMKLVAEVARTGARVYLVADDWELVQIANGPRSALLAGATPLGHVEPGYTAVFLLDPERALAELRRAAAALRDPANVAEFEGEGERSGAVWRLDGRAAVALPGNADPAVARVCASGSDLTVLRRGVPPAAVRAGTCADVPLLPGRAEGIVLDPAGGARRSPGTVEVRPLAELREPGLLATAYLVPQAARLTGVDGSFWQTDLLLVNPQSRSLTVTGLFLPTGKGNARAQAASAVIPAGGSLELRNVLGVSAFAQHGRLGALLVHAGEPGAPCRSDGCRFLVCSRTWNSLGRRRAAAGAEWLPGLPYAAGIASGSSVFTSVAGGQGDRASVGVVAWSGAGAAVRVLCRPRGGTPFVRDGEVPPFGHLRVDLGAWPAGGEVEVALRRPLARGRLFAYVSVVGGASGATRHLLPDNAGPRSAAGVPPLPRPETGEAVGER